MISFQPRRLDKGGVFPGISDVTNGFNFVAEGLDEIVVNGSLLGQQYNQFFVLFLFWQMVQNVLLQTPQHKWSESNEAG